jgi:hypothetical protein
VIEPLLLKCGGNACKSCVKDSHFVIRCYNCNNLHEKRDLLECSENKMAESVISSSVDELFSYLNTKLENTVKSINGKVYLLTIY